MGIVFGVDVIIVVVSPLCDVMLIKSLKSIYETKDVYETVYSELKYEAT